LHRFQRLDGARQLAFEARCIFMRSWPWVWPKRVLVQQLVAADRALGQAGGGQLHAQFVHRPAGTMMAPPPSAKR
jgi:hypothetical protein